MQKQIGSGTKTYGDLLSRLWLAIGCQEPAEFEIIRMEGCKSDQINNIAIASGYDYWPLINRITEIIETK
jgi:hypothetical protein